MKTEELMGFDKQIYYRLIALWVLCESVVGGMIHGLKLPVSGLIVGSSAVICICLIAWYVPIKGAILKATVIVAIFKMMLSPHTPLPAYIAVFFQGFIGQLLFFNLRYYKVACILLGVLALVESAAQRIIVLTVLYGTNFWKAVNEFISKVSGQDTITNYSLFFTIAYLLLHAIVGIAVGSLAIYISKRLEYWKNEKNIILEKNVYVDPIKKEKSKLGSFRKALWAVWVILFVLFLQSYLNIGDPLLQSSIVFQIFLRSVLIFLAWYLFVSPLLTRAINHWLQKQKKKSKQDIDEIILLLPSTKYILAKSWE